MHPDMPDHCIFPRASGKLLLACALLLAGFSKVVSEVPLVPLHVDEPTYMSYARWVKSWWDEGIRREAQQLTPYTLGVPPITLYVTGGLLLAGEGEFGDYVLRRDAQLNWDLANSRLPPIRDLLFVRTLLAYLFVLSAVILGRLSAPARDTTSAGAIASLVLSTSYLVGILTRVMTEPAMVLSLCVNALLIVAAARKLTGAKGWRWAVAAGLVCGVGVASKHNLAVSIPVTGAAVLSAHIVKHRNWRAAGRGVLQATLSAVVSLGTFYLLSPVLHPAPLERLVAMVRMRVHLIASQHVEYPQTALRTLGERVDRAANRLLNSYGLLSCARPRATHVVPDLETRQFTVRPSRHPLLSTTALCQPLAGWITPVAIANAALSLAGLLVLLRPVRRAALMLVAFLGCHALVSIVFIPHDWAHYYAIPAALGALLASVALADAIKRISARLLLATLAR